MKKAATTQLMYFEDDEDEDEFRLPFTWASCLTVIMGVVGYAAIGIGFGMAMGYTTIANVLIFANSQSILLLLGKILNGGGDSVLFMEGLGVFVALAGAILCSKDSDQTAQQNDEQNYQPYQTVWGDLLALSAGIGGVVYLVSAGALREKVDILVYMPLNMLAGSFLVLGFITVVLEQHVSMSRNPHHGLFGWMTPGFDRLWLELYTIFGCSIFGTIGYIHAMKHIDTLTVTIACLLEPMIATLIAYACGVGHLPGLVGWIGNLLVVAGTVAVVYPSVQQDQSQT
uniref:EamA domain-containing protein n=1 Tax=Cyclophora tenuis TaxID=216820 RepID=A0A7S1GKU9_CYCTE|mmetsp:Transcript_24122/g.41003  ORF Transcript_24122/g.41003 Transcript_24122/m.41003 type:complete len:285 (+) Transcript_24122:1-855(+)